MEIWLDITFATSIVSCFAKNLSQQYIKAMITIIHYLKAIRIIGIIYSNSKENGNLIIKSYLDSD